MTTPTPGMATGDASDNVVREEPTPPAMRFMHTRRYLNKGDIVQLDCDTQCNFMLLTDDDFAAYQRVALFQYHGGTFKIFPARITVPETGHWNIIIDLAGAKGEIKYNITLVLDHGT